MASTSNLKDTLTTICGIVLAISGGLVTAHISGLVLPAWLVTASGVLATVSGAIIGWLTGKAPNATTKTPDQVVAGNTTTP